MRPYTDGTIEPLPIQYNTIQYNTLYFKEKIVLKLPKIFCKVKEYFASSDTKYQTLRILYYLFFKERGFCISQPYMCCGVAKGT